MKSLPILALIGTVMFSTAALAQTASDTNSRS